MSYSPVKPSLPCTDPAFPSEIQTAADFQKTKNLYIKEGCEMKKTTKGIKKDKKFWADPMCYPVFTV